LLATGRQLDGDDARLPLLGVAHGLLAPWLKIASMETFRHSINWAAEFQVRLESPVTGRIEIGEVPSCGPLDDPRPRRNSRRVFVPSACDVGGCDRLRLRSYGRTWGWFAGASLRL